MKKALSVLVLVTLLFAALLGVASAAPPQQGGQEYTVQADDWLSKIAEKSFGDPLAYTAIFEATNAAAAAGGAYDVIADPNVIEVGQVVCIPPMQ